MTVAPSQRSARLLIMAAAGYGKSAALEAERPMAGVVCSAADALRIGLPTAPWIGVEDVDALDLDDQRELVGRLNALPAGTGVCLTSRTPWSDAVQDELRGAYLARGPEDLALDAFGVARLLAEEYAVHDPEVAARVRDATAGWPALVHFAGDALSRDPAIDPRATLSAPDGPAARWMRRSVLQDLKPSVDAVLGLVAGLGPLTPTLLRRLTDLLRVDPIGVEVDRLLQQGVLLRRRGEAGVLDLVPALADWLARRHEAQPTPDLLRAVGASYEADGLLMPAVGAFRRAGATDQVTRLLVDRGGSLVRGGHAQAVADATASLPLDSPALRRNRADALRRLGDGPAARRVLEPDLVGDGAAARDPGLATLLATAHYTEGDLPAALTALDEAREAVRDDLGGVEWRCCRVQVLAMVGRREDAGPLADEALRCAEISGDPLALAAAHLARSRVTSGARKEAHLEAALQAAVRAGDRVTAALVRVNQSHLLLAAARYAEAVDVAREAVDLSSSSPTGRFSAALHNLAEALTQTGAFEEARWHLRRAMAHARRLGAGRTALGLFGLAEIDRLLGQDERAGLAYAEAIALSRASGELQVLVPALAGLARVHARSGRLDEAALLVAEADSVATPDLVPYAQVAAGWIAYRQGFRAEAAEIAHRAARLAGSVGAHDLLAEALELVGVVSPDPSAARNALVKALTVWRDGGAGPRTARVEVALGRLTGADGAARSRSREAARLLQQLGVLGIDELPVEARQPAPVTISVLGGFSVQVGTEPVPLPAWRSRQARTLVRILAARRGRPVTRERLCELLWPDDDPARTGHRLSVLLATVRGVLDPAKAWPTDRFIVADSAGLRLCLAHVAVDADGIVHDAASGAEQMDDGNDDRALEILADVDGRYLGDAFEDDVGEEWADAFREEVRGAWLRSLRRLAVLRRRRGRLDDAQASLLRLLAADPYDEQAHAMLVRLLQGSGRHGEARRAFARWCAAMAAIDAPAPDPSVVQVPPDRRSQPGASQAALGRARLVPRPAL